jgi:hypothetical protein
MNKASPSATQTARGGARRADRPQRLDVDARLRLGWSVFQFNFIFFYAAWFFASLSNTHAGCALTVGPCAVAVDRQVS